MTPITKREQSIGFGCILNTYAITTNKHRIHKNVEIVRQALRSYHHPKSLFIKNTAGPTMRSEGAHPEFEAALPHAIINEICNCIYRFIYVSHIRMNLQPKPGPIQIDHVCNILYENEFPDPTQPNPTHGLYRQIMCILFYTKMNFPTQPNLTKHRFRLET